MLFKTNIFDSAVSAAFRVQCAINYWTRAQQAFMLEQDRVNWISKIKAWIAANAYNATHDGVYDEHREKMIRAIETLELLKHSELLF